MKSIKQDVVKNIEKERASMIFWSIVLFLTLTIACFSLVFSIANIENEEKNKYIFWIIASWLFFVILIVSLAIHENKCLNGELEDIKRRSTKDENEVK